MPDHYRRQMTGPLDYARDFVGSNAGMEAAKYQQQVTLLGEGRDATLRFGLFRQLVGLASNQDRPYRGYLLDADCQPLSDSMLARLLKWDLAELRKEMKVLVAAGLVEHIPEPNYVEQDQADLPPDGGSNGEQPGVRRSARDCAKVRAPSRKQVKRESKEKQKNEILDPEGSAECAAPSQGATEDNVRVQPESESVANSAGPCPPKSPEGNPKPERNPKESEGGGRSALKRRRPLTRLARGMS